MPGIRPEKEVRQVRTLSAEQFQIEITCRQVWREVSNFYEGEIPNDLRTRIERHLEGCSHCRAVYDGLRNTVTLVVDSDAFELPPDVSERLYGRLRNYLAKKS